MNLKSEIVEDNSAQFSMSVWSAISCLLMGFGTFGSVKEQYMKLFRMSFRLPVKFDSQVSANTISAAYKVVPCCLGLFLGRSVELHI